MWISGVAVVLLSTQDLGQPIDLLRQDPAGQRGRPDVEPFSFSAQPALSPLPSALQGSDTDQ